MTVDRQQETRSIGNARRLRREQTDAERRVWHLLGNRQLAGLKFRRQHPVGPYIVDFFCEARGLVIEIDGGQHRPKVDGRRTAYLEAHGLTVLRFWNNDVLGNTDGVTQAILRHVEGGEE